MNKKSKEALISFDIFLHIFTRIAGVSLIAVGALIIETHSTNEVVSSLVANMPTGVN
jgi:hypothetical protein